MAYVKLFQSLLDSTIWAEPDSTRIVWLTMLVIADKNGEVMSTVPGLAHRARVPIEACQSAIDKLSSPDRYSRSKLAEGRRIVAIEGGWELVNHADYRMKASKEDEKRATAERVRRHRERSEGIVTCNGKDGQCNGKNDQCNGGVTVDRDIAESESDSEPFLNTFTPNGSAVAPATPSQEKDSDLLENEETGGNTLFSQFDGLHDTFPVLTKTSAFPAKETANAGHPADSTKAKRKKHERNALLDALVVLDGTVLEFATGPAWSRAAAALKTIREVSPNVTASEIEAASRAYKRKFPDAICSSSALAKWWGSLQVPEPKSAYPSYSIGAPLTPEQKAEGEARANEMRQFLRANLTTT